MATDAQGRQLSDDGNYYWDGANWQLVDQGASGGGDPAAAQSAQSAQSAQAADAQGRQLSADGSYYWDGANWQLVDQGAASGHGGGDPQAGGVGDPAATATAGTAQDQHMSMPEGSSEGWLDVGEQLPEGFDEYVSGTSVNTDLLGWTGCTPCVLGWKICYGTLADLEKKWDRCYACEPIGSSGKIWKCPC